MKSAKYAALFFLIILLSSIRGSFAQPIPSYELLTENDQLKPFQVYVIEDSSRKMTIEDVASGDIKGTLSSSRFYVQSTEVNYWFSFTVVNRTDKTLSRVVRFDEPYAEEANLYYREGDAWHIERAGLAVPLEQRPIHNRNPLFSVMLKPGQSRTIYLKLHSNYGMLTIGIFCEKPAIFLNNEQLQTAGYLFYFGAACALLIYNLFLFASLRERLYLYYVLHGLSYISWVLLYSGFDLYFGISELLHYRLNSITNFIFVFFVLFTRDLLHTKEKLPKIDKVLVLIMLVSFFSGIASFIEVQYYQYLTFLALPSYLFFIFVGIYASLQRINFARYYLISMSLYFTGIILLGLLLMDVAPYNLFTRYFYLPGSLAELTIFSFALAHRVKILQSQNILYQQQLTQSERKAREKLEIKVSERTCELRKANQELQRIARIDGLTGLANRRFLDECLQQEWRRLIREKKLFSVILCDIDHFKKFNDYYGHQKGDECLIQVANAIKQSLKRSGDLGGRYGGEEFLILLPNTDTKGAVAIAEKIRMTLEKMMISHAKSTTAVYVTMSFGVATIRPCQGGRKEELIASADQALYAAKDKGRNQVCSEMQVALI